MKNENILCWAIALCVISFGITFGTLIKVGLNGFILIIGWVILNKSWRKLNQIFKENEAINPLI